MTKDCRAIVTTASDAPSRNTAAPSTQTLVAKAAIAMHPASTTSERTSARRSPSRSAMIPAGRAPTSAPMPRSATMSADSASDAPRSSAVIAMSGVTAPNPTSASVVGR